LALADPRTGNWHLLRDPALRATVEAAACVIRDEPAAAAASLARGELGLDDLDPADVFRSLPATADALNAQYEKLLGLLVSGSCPPHETEYIHGKLTFQRSHGLADVAGFYRAFGLTMSRRHPERHDHVAVELEFVALLFELENCALDARGNESFDRAIICRDARRRFLAEHVTWWVPTFARLLAIENPGGFYGAVGRFVAALIAAERSLTHLAAPSGPVTASSIERPEECEGCAVGDLASL
jgi:TorA maturation chaperone TorD